MEITASAASAHGKIRDLGALTQLTPVPATLTGLQCINLTGVAVYIQIFDAQSSSVTLGTTRPDLEFLVASNAFFNAILPAGGVAFNSAICLAATTGESAAATTGATPAAAGLEVFTQTLTGVL